MSQPKTLLSDNVRLLFTYELPGQYLPACVTLRERERERARERLENCPRKNIFYGNAEERKYENQVSEKIWEWKNTEGLCTE